ncbi:hypothetical protein DPMN_068494 [Dreissena polymorpha]|uniref:Uncharacterized protein n=1 Tax=Dreissena polymorpha TaxID=45954 RepID=A0A9D3Z2L5_DREPO|nr:hypothetical protein DPMN_068494 [Dreissena polymorpha]
MELICSVQPQDIIRTDVLIKFHEEFYYSHITIYSPTPGGYVFQQTGTIFELIRDSIKKILTKKNAPPPGSHTINVTFRVKNAHPIESMFFQETETIFELFHEHGAINVAFGVLTMLNFPDTWLPYVIGTYVLTKFHEDWTINLASRVKNDPPNEGQVFQPTGTIFELVQVIIGTNILTKFREDRKINVASRVLTSNRNPFIELVQNIVETNLMTKFNEDWTINVASIVLQGKC